jgi:hypothetical protein
MPEADVDLLNGSDIATPPQVSDGLLLGFGEVELYTNAAFIANLAFYRKRGYQEYRTGTMLPVRTAVFTGKAPARYQATPIGVGPYAA